MSRRLPDDIFNDALDLDPSKREAFLVEACGEDSALRADVDSLLALEDGAGDILQPPQPSPMEEREQIGTYKVLEKLGLRYQGLCRAYGVDGTWDYALARTDWQRRTSNPRSITRGRDRASGE